MKYQSLKSRLMGGIAIAALASSSAYAANFNIPGGDLAPALDAYQAQSGVPIVIAANAVKNIKTRGVKGDLPAQAALTEILKGTGFVATLGLSGVMEIVPEHKKTSEAAEPVTRLADVATPAHAAVGIESVVVTSSKIKGDIQTVPIAITALSQEQLTERQIAGGPDLVKEVPNLTFTKTNFTGYNIQIRGIGTQAVSVATDPAVAIAFNDTPFLRNHFFEQEFFDVSQVEVLRGPQGTLFGRNANAGVVNIVSAKPTDQFEAMLSADWGNFSNRRYEGMINIPIVDDKLALRVAGEWTKRDGYARNENTGQQIDGRDLWSSRVSLRWKPTEKITADFIWEHFQENDDRLRSGKQLCKNDPGPSTLATANGTVVNVPGNREIIYSVSRSQFSQGCLPTSLYDKGDPAHGDYGAFGVPNGFSLPFITAAGFIGVINQTIDPYASDHQSTNLRDIQSEVDPRYIAKNDTLEFNAEWNVTPALTFNSETGYNRDFLWSTQDLNRFNTSGGIFNYTNTGNARNDVRFGFTPDPAYPVGSPGHPSTPGAIFCDPQLGCSDRMVLQDLSTEDAWQFSQEFRLASSFKGPFNFSAGGNYLHYETEDKYYVFSNVFTMIAHNSCSTHVVWIPGVSNDLFCLSDGKSYVNRLSSVPSQSPAYIDPSSLTGVGDDGHNYFLSRNPYVLNSYALFGEAYYDITPDVKLTGGLRWTDDEKHFPEFPSQVLLGGYGIPRTGQVDQSWKKYSGRAVVNWQPHLDFTDQTMVYASYSHGYKAGGANPPPAVLSINGGEQPVHPLTFDPEYIDAFELGTKNTALDGGLVFNGDIFYYNYKGYQISQLVDRTSVNFNVDATIQGAEIQASWSPLPSLKFGFNGGYEDTRINNNQYFIDLMDRTYGHHDTWTIMKPWAGEASNCIFPTYVAAEIVQNYANYGQGNPATQSCGNAYVSHIDPVTGLDYDVETNNGTTAPTSSATGFFHGSPGYPGYDPFSVDPNLDPGAVATVNNGLGLPPNNGQGFAKNVGGNVLPNAPHFTASLTGDYTMPVSANWAATLHSDFYWQSQSMARIFNDRPYDKIRGYSNVNLALILNDATGWQVMGYVKNIFDTTAISGDFLYTDDVGLTTNIFLTDPRLYGVRITKQFGDSDGAEGGFDLFSDADGKKPLIWLTLGGNYSMLAAKTDVYNPDYLRPGGTLDVTDLLALQGLPAPASYEKTPRGSFDWEGELRFQPEDSNWVLKAGIRYGRSSSHAFVHQSLDGASSTRTKRLVGGKYFACTTLHTAGAYTSCKFGVANRFEDAHAGSSERHAVMDFDAGQDVGMGLFGGTGEGNISAGVRLAQFDSRANASINSDPEYHLEANTNNSFHNVYEVESQETRSFRGIGPEVTWDANQTVWGNPSDGEITFDWGVNASVLFGRQSVDLHHFTSQCHHIGQAECEGAVLTQDTTIRRKKNVTVPNLGGYGGLSVRYSNAKISLGYRADEFFGAMDGGEYTAKDYNRAFYGPYLNLSVGFGG